MFVVYNFGDDLDIQFNADSVLSSYSWTGGDYMEKLISLYTGKQQCINGQTLYEILDSYSVSVC